MKSTLDAWGQQAPSNNPQEDLGDYEEELATLREAESRGERCLPTEVSPVSRYLPSTSQLSPTRQHHDVTTQRDVIRRFRELSPVCWELRLSHRQKFGGPKSGKGMGGQETNAVFGEGHALFKTSSNTGSRRTTVHNQASAGHSLQDYQMSLSGLFEATIPLKLSKNTEDHYLRLHAPVETGHLSRKISTFSSERSKTPFFFPNYNSGAGVMVDGRVSVGSSTYTAYENAIAGLKNSDIQYKLAEGVKNWHTKKRRTGMGSMSHTPCDGREFLSTTVQSRSTPFYWLDTTTEGLPKFQGVQGIEPGPPVVLENDDVGTTTEVVKNVPVKKLLRVSLPTTRKGYKGPNTLWRRPIPLRLAQAMRLDNYKVNLDQYRSIPLASLVPYSHPELTHPFLLKSLGKGVEERIRETDARDICERVPMN